MARTVLTTVVATVTVLALAGCTDGRGDEPEPTTAWQAREQLSDYLLQTAEAVGLDAVVQLETSDEVLECARRLRVDGTGVLLQLVRVEGDAGDAEQAAGDALAAVAERWADDGYDVAETTATVRAGNPDDGLLEAMRLPGGGTVVLTGSTPCMDEAGSADH